MEPQTKVCPACGNENPSTALTCPQCGVHFDVKITGYCFNCHETAEADASGNCLRCRGPVVDPQVESKVARVGSLLTPPAAPGAPAQRAYEPGYAPPDLGAPAIGSLEEGVSPRRGGLERQLLPGEKIVYHTRLHGLMLVSAIFSILIAIGLYYWTREAAATPYSQEFAVIFQRNIKPGDTIMDVLPESVYTMYFIAFLVACGGLGRLFTWLFAHLAITNQRLLGRLGALIPRRIDIPHGSIASVIYARGLGNQGRVVINYLPRRMLNIPYVPRPAEFYQRLYAYLPDRLPKLERVKVGRFLLVFFLALLIIAGAVFAAYYFTEGKDTLQPVAEASLSTIDQFSKNRRVTIEGILEMPSSVSCDTNCNLYLVDYQDPSKKLIIFVNLAKEVSPAPGEMKRLPYNYKKSDLAVALADGGYAGHGTDVRLTGKVCETTRGTICLLVSNAESGTLPDTPTPTLGPTFTPTLSPTPTRTLRPTKTQTRIPSITPTPLLVTYDNICSYVDRLVIVRGRLSVSSVMTFCSGGRCPLYLKEPGGIRQLRITIGYKGGPNQMDQLPNNYTTKDLKVHTADNQVVGNNALVEIMGKLTKYETESKNMLQCSLSVITVNIP